MVKTNLPFTYLAKGRYWRFRHPQTGDVSLPGQPGGESFHSRYAELLARATATRTEVDRASIAWLTNRYRKSAEFRALADATQTDYEKTLALIDEHLGAEPYRLTTRGMIKAVRDDHSATPRKAHKIKQMMSRLYSWADENDLVPEGFNPAAKLKRLATKGGSREYTVWSESEFDQFFAGAIVPMKTAAMLARYTGQRVQDVGKMTWADYQVSEIRVRQSKTGTPLMIACHSALRAYLDDLKRRLDAKKKRGVLILMSAAGRAYNANSLSSAVGREVRRIKGMPADRSLHGLRYMAGSDMEEAGCTVGEIEAVLGHQTFKMALKYASQRLRAKAAMAKVEGANNG